MTTTAEPPFRSSRYTTGAILLHWLIALLVLAQIAGGYAMTDILQEGSATQYDVFQLHKSLGITILVLTLARILWRFFNPPPAMPASVSRLERGLARLVHVVFYALLLVIPLSGWVLISASPVDVDTVLFFQEALPWPNLPGFGGFSAETQNAFVGTVGDVHATLAYAVALLVVLHIVGAVKHQFAERGYLARMWPVSRGDGPRRAFGHFTTIALPLLFVAIMVAIATQLRPSDTPSGLASSGPAAVGEAGSNTWTLVPETSLVTFSFTFQGAEVKGAIGSFSADIVFDESDLPGSHIAAAFDLSSASIEGTAVTKNQLLGADGLAVETDPVARFEADTINAVSGDSYIAQGTLTLRGKAVPVSLPFTLAIADGAAVADGSVSLDRTTFDIGVKNDPDGSWIAPEVIVRVHIEALNEAQSGKNGR
ncbi:cytochrome b/b6 domain-containing protein [Acuticoccus sp. M5D2P5]|uniref:cytochrome b/b6 domain-containing protein n=1 Tax=Acuticoccus kalidii TaxID=2910977 RepID=UPI001F2EFEFB|nr:cytochrome b/b6 domain-containing protein [Acuticoccus kalidii]